MNLYWLSLFLTVASNVGYHFCQKEIRPEAPPFLSLVVSYSVALVTTVMMIGLFPDLSGSAGWKALSKVGWASYALGFALVGLELGFLLAYRSGWKISFAALFSNLAVTLVLIPVGLLVYREGLTPSKWFGLLFSVLGLWLLGGK